MGLAIGQNKTWQTLGEVLAQSQPSGENPQQSKGARLKAQREWCGAIASLEQLLLQVTDTSTNKIVGLVLSGPAPILSHEALISRFQTGIFTPEAFKSLALMPCQLPAAKAKQKAEVDCHIAEYPLLPNDPLTAEQFCLVLTHSFSLVMVLAEDATGTLGFQFSFEPEVINQCWAKLRSRLLLTSANHLQKLDNLVAEFSPQAPDYRIVMQFSRQLLKYIPDLPVTEETKVSLSESEKSRCAAAPKQQIKPKTQQFNDSPAKQTPEVELLQALTHEIRTPLTTIRMLTRLLMKRRDLTADVIKRLEVIDQECTEQINRMELIFRAAELETKSLKQERVSLTSTSLEQVLKQSIPCWKKQAQRRNVTLDVVLPKKLPTVVSNPVILDQVLTGLMENFTRSLPTGGHIQVQVTTAGNQLKLQLLTQCPSQASNKTPFSINFDQPQFRSIGQLLLFRPETGSLCLNLDVTKNLFHALGGKMIVRQRPQQGEVLTIFLPLGNQQSEVDSNKSIFSQRD